MKNLLLRRSGLVLLLSAGSLSGALATTASAFVDQAAQGGITEVEMGKLALEKSASADIKAFATQMVRDHTAANQSLMALAGTLDIQVPDEASLTAKAKKAILEMRKESFDKAYINNQVMAHEQTVALFKKEAASSDKPELKAFAQETLPKLEHHLEMARQLQAQSK